MSEDAPAVRSTARCGDEPMRVDEARSLSPEAAVEKTGS
jgi:hypothetical protein